MKYNFFAMHSRMKYINRWALMRNTQSENICEHSNDVAAIAHALAVIKNKRFGANVNADRAAVLGLYHDMTEIITGDMPTPVKYHSKELRKEYAQVEEIAGKQLLDMLPPDMREDYYDCFFHSDDEELYAIVKAADKISALIKCIQELACGNNEFKEAYKATLKAVKDMKLPEADAFLQDFIDGYSLSLDELTKKED